MRFAVPPGQYLDPSRGFGPCAASGDGAGYLAFIPTETAAHTAVELFLVAPTGTPISAPLSFVNAWGAGVNAERQVLEQASGFMGIFQSPGTNPYLGAVHDDGGLSPEVPSLEVGETILSEDPFGGLVYLAWTGGGLGANATIPAFLGSFDASGNQRWAYQIPGPAIPDDFMGASMGVDLQGNTLLLLGGTAAYPGQAEGRWIDSHGTLGPTFPAGQNGGVFFPRIGGGLFLQTEGSLVTQDHRWAATFPPLATTYEPPPPWLASRPNSALHVIRGGQAYAVYPAPWTAQGYWGPTSYVIPPDPCPQSVEVLLPDGESCGSAQLPNGSGICDIELGADGTLIQLLPIQTNCDASGDCACAWQFWPGYLE